MEEGRQDTDDKHGGDGVLAGKDSDRGVVEEQRGRGGGCLPFPSSSSSTLSATPPTPIPGMMSAFIDFVKPFPMLLPMCLQDSKSRSIRGDGGGARNASRDIQVAGKEDHCPGANSNFAAF